MSLVSVPYERTQARARRNFYLSDKLSHTVDLTRCAHAFSTTGDRAAENDLPNQARYDDRAG